MNPPTPFTLEPDTAIKRVVQRTCGNCRHFEPYRDQGTGRVHPSKRGRCGWKPEIEWPLAFRRAGNGWTELDPVPYSIGMWKDSDASTCACWVLKEGTKQ